MERNKRDFSSLRYLNLVYQFFLETFIGLAIGYFGGEYLDHLLFGDRKILVYILMVLGIFSALVNLIRRVLKRIGNEERNANEDEKR